MRLKMHPGDEAVIRVTEDWLLVTSSNPAVAIVSGPHGPDGREFKVIPQDLGETVVTVEEGWPDGRVTERVIFYVVDPPPDVPI